MCKAVAKRNKRCMTVSEHGKRLRIVTRLGEMCTAVPLQLKAVTRQDKVRGAWQCQNMVKGKP